MNGQETISIIITTKNEAKNIKNCLESIKNQTYPHEKIEIIVVDNNSEDKTKEIAKEYTNNIFNVGPERSAQRNFGIQKSKGNWFIYVDADMIFSPELVESCFDYIVKNSDTIALYISEIILGKNFWSKVRRFERSFYDGTVIDCARFIKKSSFLKVKGFDMNLTGPEDWDLDKKLRNIGKVFLLPKKLNIRSFNKNWDSCFRIFLGKKGINYKTHGNVIFHNESEFGLKKYLQKKGYYIKSFDKYINKWGKDDPDIQKQVGLWYRFFGVFTENKKWKKLLLHPIFTSSMYFLRFLLGIKFLLRKIK